MRVGLYARVSTKDQNCDMQLRDLRAYYLARQLVIVHEYIDVGQSGTRDSRPQLNELMDDARKRKLDLVVCWRFDRFARSTIAEGFRQRPNIMANMCIQQFAEVQFLVRDEQLNQRLVDRIKTDPHGTIMYAMQMGGAHPV
jgi:DNA invertase Pin-like site-specific DNA recombinase